MRLALIAIAGCQGHDYALTGRDVVPVDVVPSCISVESYVLCSLRVDHATAEATCDAIGAALIDPAGDYEEQEHVAALGLLAWPEDPVWWAGWSDEYDCPVMGQAGSVSPADCDERHPFVCEFGEA